MGSIKAFSRGQTKSKTALSNTNLGHPSLGEHVPVFSTFANEHKKNVGNLLLILYQALLDATIFAAV